jgi:ribonuclease R
LIVTHEILYKNIESSLLYNKWYYSIIKSKNKYNYDYVDSIFINLNVNNNVNVNHNVFKIIYDTSMIIKKDIPDFNLVNETKSHIMVKYWMIKVNQIMCETVQKIYRCNLKPSNNKFELLQNYFEYKGLNIENICNDRIEMIKYIDENPSKFNYYMIKNLLTKAYYYSTDKSHYGLGINNYTHWTSPIRRACDLLNHCILKGFDIDIEQYLEYMNEMELKQDLIEDFIINFNNYQTIRIDSIFEATIIKLNSNCIIIYIEDLDNKFSLHIIKHSISSQKQP